MQGFAGDAASQGAFPAFGVKGGDGSCESTFNSSSDFYFPDSLRFPIRYALRDLRHSGPSTCGVKTLAKEEWGGLAVIITCLKLILTMVARASRPATLRRPEELNLRCHSVGLAESAKEGPLAAYSSGLGPDVSGQMMLVKMSGSALGFPRR